MSSVRLGAERAANEHARLPQKPVLYISYAADGENGGGPRHALPTSMAPAM